jgi:hypothetical protein
VEVGAVPPTTPIFVQLKDGWRLEFTLLDDDYDPIHGLPYSFPLSFLLDGYEAHAEEWKTICEQRKQRNAEVAEAERKRMLQARLQAQEQAERDAYERLKEKYG